LNGCRNDGKTLIWAGLTFDNASLKTVYAPRGEWVPDSFIEPSANVLPGESFFISRDSCIIMLSIRDVMLVMILISVLELG
jgi:hypothetical protein